MITLLLALLMPSYSVAAVLDGTLNVGIGKNVLQRQPFERYAAAGVRYGGSWKVAANGGYWLALADGERSSWFGSVQGGLEVQGQGGTTAAIFFGPSYVHQDDSKLSGHFQFHTTFSVGVKAGGLGIVYEWVHFSNAGIKLPNNGRDLWTAKIIVPFKTWE